MEIPEFNQICFSASKSSAFPFFLFFIIYFDYTEQKHQLCKNTYFILHTHILREMEGGESIVA